MNLTSLSYSKMIKNVANVIKCGRTPMIWGPPGVGKTSLALEVGNIIGKEKVLIIESCLYSPTDFHVAVPENGKLVDYVYDIPENSLVVVDDITMAEEFQMKSIIKMVFEKRLGNHTINNVDFIMTGNRVEDLTSSYDLLSTIKTRVVHFELKPDVEEWISWAVNNNIRKEIISFLLAHPNMFLENPKESRTWATPRTWHILSDVINSCYSYDSRISPDRDMEAIVCGCVGNEVGSHFCNFLKYMYSFSPKEALKQGSIVVQGENSSDDRMCIYARLMSLAEYVYDKVYENTFTKEEADGLGKIFSALNGEYKTLFFRRIAKFGKVLDLSIVTILVNNFKLPLEKYMKDVMKASNK